MAEPPGWTPRSPSGAERPVAGRGGRFDLDLAEQVTYGDGAVLQQFQDPDAYRVSEHPEELGLGLAEKDLQGKSLPATCGGLYPGPLALNVPPQTVTPTDPRASGLACPWN